MRNKLLLLFALMVSPLPAVGQTLTQGASPRVHASPNEGWTDLPQAEEPSTGRQILLWLPNRIIDFLDIFRVDLGVGPAAGGVVRVTKYAQAGYRQMLPMSARVGLMGRQSPVMLETANEIGVGPVFIQNSKRNICAGEVGLGLDLFVAGGYAGICFDEVVDFVGGIFTLDPKDDDFK